MMATSGIRWLALEEIRCHGWKFLWPSHGGSSESPENHIQHTIRCIIRGLFFLTKDGGHDLQLMVSLRESHKAAAQPSVCNSLGAGG